MKEITRQLKAQGYSVAGIAATLNVAAPTVSQTIHGRTVSARIRAAIAEALGRTVEDIWPPADAGQKNTPGPDAIRAL